MRRLLFPGFVMACLLLYPAAARAIVNVGAVHVGAPTERFSGNSNRFRGKADATDFRLLEEAALHVRLNIEVRYDSRPPQTVKTTDITYTTGITVSL